MLRFLIISFCLIFSCAALAEAPANLQVFLADPSSLSELTPTVKSELDRFYAQRGYKAAWDVSDDVALKKICDFIDSIDALVSYHGLMKEAYPISLMKQLALSKTDLDKEKLEFMITASLLRLAHDLHGDSVNLDTLYTGWVFHRQPTDIPALLSTSVAEGTLSQLFDKLPPQNKAYSDLTKALQIYTLMFSKGEWPTLNMGAPLKPHDHDPRVKQLRTRLVAEGYVLSPASEGEDAFDDALIKTLITYQVNNGLSPDGRLGNKTLESLNTSLANRIIQIRANMERWRHMPEDFPPDRYTLINIPDFSVTIVENKNLVYRGIVVDGKPDRQTPFIDSKITNMLVNPPWNVPLSIARKDILPKLRKDPHYLEKLGIIIANRPSDPTGATIDWKDLKAEDFNYQLRQDPSDMNSLGQLKFNFANPFSVYMHGTPHQELFDKSERDFSSGCVRLEDPVRVGEILLSYNKDRGGWPQQRINDTIDAGKSVWVLLAKPMPIYILYWSVFTNDDGQINFRKDIYNYDNLLIDKMKKKETN